MKLFIFPHDGTLEGDSSFCPGTHFAKPIPYYEGMTLEKLQNEVFNLDPYELELSQQMADETKGGWVLDEVSLQSAREFDDCLPDAGCDSACYANNHAVKNYLTLKAIKFLGPRPK